MFQRYVISGKIHKVFENFQEHLRVKYVSTCYIKLFLPIYIAYQNFK